MYPCSSWEQVKQRVGPYRRVFAFFHPQLPEDPLAFVCVALSDHLCQDVQAILNADISPNTVEDPRKCSHAIFYSISSPHSGLRGQHMGDPLIKEATKQLMAASGSYVHVFSTLSPIPGFREWLIQYLVEGHCQSTTLHRHLHSGKLWQELPDTQALKSALAHDGGLSLDLNTLRQLEETLKTLCCRYLYHEKGPRGSVLNRVANFHIQNGATLFRVNSAGDLSSSGMARSLGMLVNYKYEVPNIVDNAKQFDKFRTVPVSSEVHQMLL